MKTLFMGDPHAKVSNIKDLEKIFDFSFYLIKEHKIDQAVILGDLYDTHAVLRQEVIDFYQKNIYKLVGYSGRLPIVLVGNHDLVGPVSNNMNAVSLTLGTRAIVVDSLYRDSNVLYLSFIPSKAEFIDICNKNSDLKTVICHQTFDGAQYENGFFAPDGIDLNSIPQKLVISGHVHKRSIIGNKIKYVGTPRALNANDCNEDKGLEIWDTDTGDFLFYSTNHLVKKYIKIDLKESQKGNLAEIVTTMLTLHGFNENDDIRVTISGTEEFYNSSLEELKEFKGKVRLIPQISKSNNRKFKASASSNDIYQSLSTYVKEIAEIDSNLKEAVWKKMTQLMPSLNSKT